MRRSSATAGSVAFFVLGPGVVAVLVPWWITGWRAATPLPYWLGARLLGGVLVAAGAVVLVRAFARFVTEGLGTPLPVAPPDRLVVGGLFRYVRNPMYVALLALILGQALLLGRGWLVLYAAAAWAATASFVRFYEEPTLRRRFGADYDGYRRAVRGWWPRLRPWRGPANPSGRSDVRNPRPGGQG